MTQQHAGHDRWERTIPGQPGPSVRMLDGSGTIRTGGTAQYLTDAPVGGYELSNPDPTEDLWVADNGNPAAPNGAGSIRVIANGGTYWTPDHWPPLWQRVSCYGATTGHAFTFRYW